MNPLPHPHHDLQPVVIRLSEPEDRLRLERLAGRDSRRVPEGRLLLAEAEGEIVAAVPLAAGEAIADPFRPTAGLVSLLELRVAQLRLGERRNGSGAGSPAGAWIARAAGPPAVDCCAGADASTP